MSDLLKVKELRKATGAGFKDCNNALKEADGDINKSIEILRIKGVAKATKKMSRSANEGLIAITDNKDKFSIIELNCETDFVAKNDDFIKFSEELSLINNKLSSNKDLILKELMQNGISVEENLVNLISKIGEKIVIGRLQTFDNTKFKNFKYMHTIVKNNLSKLGVIVSLETNSTDDKISIFGKQLSMHIAASNPISILSTDIGNEIIQNEKKIISEELKDSGKPNEIIEKISLGKLNKFKDENSLMTQDWVMDPKKKVKDVIQELNIIDLKIKNFCRIKIGE